MFSFCFFLMFASPKGVTAQKVKPLFVTGQVKYDTDDPAIWINKQNPSASLILGTDKEKNGALYVFNMQGEIIKDKIVHGLKRPNNVDVAYGMLLKGKSIDIAVVTERLTNKLRIYSLPDMLPVDGGGIPVFAGEPGPSRNAPMGIALYERASDKKIFAIVSRKSGPKDGTYLWQYELQDNERGVVTGKLVRRFGAFSGRQEIESIAVDDEPGYVYYSDEKAGVRKYYADPEKGNTELAFFANTGFTGEQEGISIYKTTKGAGYILVSDQQGNRFHIFTREGSNGNPHQHQLVKVVQTATRNSDGSEVTNVPILPDFPKGVFVAMSEDRTFQLYRWEDIIGNPVATPPPVLPKPEQASALIGYWRLEEQSGAILQDATVNKNNARLHGNPARINGKKGQALNLNGATEFALVPDKSALSITKAITLSAWVKPAKKGTQYIIKKAIYAKADGYELSLADNGYFFFRINEARAGNTYRLDAKKPYPFDGKTWVHLAATFDGRTIKLYVNGIENNSRTFMAPQQIRTNSQQVAIGAQPDGRYKLKGGIDDVRIYNKALAPAEVQQLVQAAPTTAAVAAPIKPIAEELTALTLQAWPNPFTTTTVIHFTLPQTAHYTLWLHDNKGAQLKQLQQGEGQAGQNISVTVDGAALAKGMYMAVLQTGGRQQTLKLFVIR